MTIKSSERPSPSFARRRFLSTMTSLAGFTFAQRAFGSSLGSPWMMRAGDISSAASSVEMIRYPQKTDLILLTDRPPQLETPLSYFRSDLTPNDAFFVRWHLELIPTTVDLATFRLEVDGHVRKPLSLSVADLKSKFEPVTLVALVQCAGNGRSFFEPRVPGGQWANGAMGNARWKGVRMKDVLDAAGVLPGAVQVGLQGLDQAPMPKTPRFEKSLTIDHARDSDVIVAYEMNGEALPMLNGFPIRLIVPGWFATYWVKSLTSIKVLDQPLKSFWMDKAYRIPDNPGANETPQQLATETVPINRMPVHSIFVTPEPGKQVRVGERCEVSGLANDGGSGIARVELSKDGGKTWSDASLGEDLGKYSWRRWRADWTPQAAGSCQLLVRATSQDGQTQPATQWNRSGYQRDVIEHLDVTVV